MSNSLDRGRIGPLQSVLTQASGLFDHRVTVAAADCTIDLTGELFPVEHSVIRGAVRHRQAEFAAGRVAARQAMGRKEAIPMGSDRAPVWPEGVRGTITHSEGIALAATTQDAALLALDLEPDAALADELWDTVLLPCERQRIEAQADPGRMARVIFSAKECAYKAQYPLTRQIFGFDVFDVTLGEGRFSARFQINIGPFSTGDVLEGRFSRGGGFIITGILAEPPRGGIPGPAPRR
ncbi:MAG: 4'-phosphopantetheinyl transferase superfamily protein [Pararhodobacter sp.]